MVQYQVPHSKRQHALPIKAEEEPQTNRGWVGCVGVCVCGGGGVRRNGGRELQLFYILINIDTLPSIYITPLLTNNKNSKCPSDSCFLKVSSLLYFAEYLQLCGGLISTC